MIARNLLVDAATACLRAGYGSTSMVQRRIRVGFVTAAQLLYALEDAKLIGPFDPARSRWSVPHALPELPAVIAGIDAAIADGRITLT